MSNNLSELSQLAHEFDRLNDELDRARAVSIEAKEILSVAQTRASNAKGKLKAFLEKAPIDFPCTIEVEGTSRLLTVYDDGHGLGFVVTAAPNPQ